MDKAPEVTRILIVDDDEAQCELFMELLATQGYRAEAAASGPEALGRARRDPPDLIVLDVGLPDLDGFEVCRHLKADARTASVPVLFVTGLSALPDKEQGLLAGGDDYVTKPVEPADLLARVRALLRVRHLNMELDRTLAYLQELEASHRRTGSSGRARRATATTMPAGAPAGHVLIVDDDRLCREVYRGLLEEAGHRVTGVGSAAEAYEAAPRGADVILLDVMMPEVSGLEALERLRQVVPEVPVIILTSYQTAQNAIAALRGGAFDFIVKGLKHEMLLHSVARALERRRLMVENRRLMEALQERLDAALDARHPKG